MKLHRRSVFIAYIAYKRAGGGSRLTSDLTALVGTFRLANADGGCDVRFPLTRE